MLAFLARLGRLEHRVVGPVVARRVATLPGRKHRRDIDARLIAQHTDAAARPLHLGARTDRDRHPVALGIRQVFANVVGRSELVGEPLHHIVDRLQLIGVVQYIPGGEGERVVASVGLRLRGHGQQELVVDGSYEVRLHVHLGPIRPGGHLLFHYIVARRNPMVPEPDRNLAGGTRGPDMNQRQRGCGSAQLQRLAAGQWMRCDH